MCKNNICIFCSGKNFIKIVEFRNHPMFGQKLLSKEELKNDFGINFDVIECNKCNLVQIGNTEKINFYDDNYLCATGNKYFEYQKNLAKKIVEEFNLNSDKKIIELGCGEGFFSKEILSYGCNLYAIEPSGKAYEHAKSLGINVERKYIKDVNKKFDFFILRQVLEHIENPNEFMLDILSIMNENFNGIIEVPRLENIYDKNRIFEFYPEHIAYYSLTTLSNLLGLYFNIDSITSTFDGQFLTAKISNKKNLNKNSYKMEELKVILNNYNNGKILMWGAGAKGINILGLLGKTELNKIILTDGDTNKIGKYTPSTHKVCEDKDSLDIKSFKAIIISADMYKEEIIRELYEKYGYRNDIILISNIPEKKNILEYYKK